MYFLLPVAAAASAPSSFTSIKAFWITLVTTNASGLSRRPEKSAAFVNIIPKPS